MDVGGMSQQGKESFPDTYSAQGLPKPDDHGLHFSKKKKLKKALFSNFPSLKDELSIHKGGRQCNT